MTFSPPKRRKAVRRPSSLSLALSVESLENRQLLSSDMLHSATSALRIVPPADRSGSVHAAALRHGPGQGEFQQTSAGQRHGSGHSLSQKHNRADQLIAKAQQRAAKRAAAQRRAAQ